MISSKFILPFIGILVLISCSKVPISNRKQMHLLNESQLIQMSELQYEEFMSTAQVLPSTHPQSRKIQRDYKINI